MEMLLSHRLPARRAYGSESSTSPRPITIRKRTITEANLKLIQCTVNEHWDKGRTQIFTPFTPEPSQYIHLGNGSLTQNNIAISSTLTSVNRGPKSSAKNVFGVTPL